MSDVDGEVERVRELVDSVYRTESRRVLATLIRMMQWTLLGGRSFFTVTDPLVE